jgi:type I restriction enzyme R subunit
LGRQALREFQGFDVPGEGRKFPELYNVQRLLSNRVDPISKVSIATIQRVYSMLKGEDLDPETEEASGFDIAQLRPAVAPVTYNPEFPIEYFDFIVADECHRSIYNLWRQVLEYFDAHLIGMTATPSKQTFGFFNQSIVMEYNHEQAVADGINVGFDVYRIKTEITERGSKVDAGYFVDRRHRQTRAVRWERLDEALEYTPNQLDRDVVAPAQIRTVIATFRDQVLTSIFPGRSEVPKTLVFAKDDSHADDIVRIVREEFGKGNDFCQKITYKTTGAKPEDLLAQFRNSFLPRIVVTVDMIATGTDVKPLEIVFFMRQVRSRNFFEQMKGRGVRVVTPTEIQAVTPGATSKTRFVIVDAVGVTESDLSDTYSLEKKPSVPLDKLLDAVAMGNREPEVISSVASRLARLDRQLTPADRAAIEQTTNGKPLKEVILNLLRAVDPDAAVEAAKQATGQGTPSEVEIAHAQHELLDLAAHPIASNPQFRQRIIDFRRSFEQVIDNVSQDRVLEAAYSAEAADHARSLVKSFEEFITEHKDEITALQVLYSRPFRQRLSFADIKGLADTLRMPPRGWTADRLWEAYQQLDRSRVRGSGQRILTDIVSLVRFAIGQEKELVPFSDLVHDRFAAWLERQKKAGKQFTPEQRQWLEGICDHIAGSASMGMEDFQLPPFDQRGGVGRAHAVFGGTVEALLDELNRELVA